MYKVFVNDKPLIFCSRFFDLPDQNNFLLVDLNKRFCYEDYIDLINRSNDLDCVVFQADDPRKEFEFFFKDFQFIEAAGGIVQNQKNEILLIYRNGCWDLPKGKVEKGEPVRLAAVREVEEECGLVGPEITDELSSTYHTYNIKGINYLKRTHWYSMKYEKEHALIPQIEEGITKAEWVNKKNLQIYIAETYGSIKSVISDFFKD